MTDEQDESPHSIDYPWTRPIEPEIVDILRKLQVKPQIRKDELLDICFTTWTDILEKRQKELEEEFKRITPTTTFIKNTAEEFYRDVLEGLQAIDPTVTLKVYANNIFHPANQKEPCRIRIDGDLITYNFDSKEFYASEKWKEYFEKVLDLRHQHKMLQNKLKHMQESRKAVQKNIVINMLAATEEGHYILTLLPKIARKVLL